MRFSRLFAVAENKGVSELEVYFANSEVLMLHYLKEILIHIK